jgi:hypothetical protein
MKSLRGHVTLPNQRLKLIEGALAAPFFVAIVCNKTQGFTTSCSWDKLVRATNLRQRAALMDPGWLDPEQALELLARLTGYDLPTCIRLLGLAPSKLGEVGQPTLYEQRDLEHLSKVMARAGSRAKPGPWGVSDQELRDWLCQTRPRSGKAAWTAARDGSVFGGRRVTRVRITNLYKHLFGRAPPGRPKK